MLRGRRRPCSWHGARERADAGGLYEGTRSITCPWGNCADTRCLTCGGSRFSWGPAWCPCDGGRRWLRCPDMEPGAAHAAVKPSLRRRARPPRYVQGRLRRRRSAAVRASRRA
jgi:hypothetical protein